MPLALLFAPALFQTVSATAYLVEVGASGRVHFRDEASASAPPRKAYVMRGDRLVADGVKGAFTSVSFVTPKGVRSDGWIETASLRRVAPPPPMLAAWAGEWSFDLASISIRPGTQRGALHVEGEAIWGGHDPERVANGGVHVGDIAGDVRPAGDRLLYTDGDSGCRVAMRLLGPYLLVDDNGQCGGVNVTFSGIYRR